jgi:hypothetical protein
LGSESGRAECALTPMQVGLATRPLSEDGGFQNVSYRFSLFSILAPLIRIVIIIEMLFFIFPVNLLATLSFTKKAEQKRRVLVA